MPYFTKCRDCRAPLPPQGRGGPRQRCFNCQAARLTAQGAENSRRWRRDNPDQAKASRLRSYAKNDYRPRAEAVAESRKRSEELVPKIQQALLEPGASFAKVAPRFGLTRNAVSGLMYRNRKWQAAQGARNE